MKKNLGRVFLIIAIFLHVELFASTYKWSATLDKTDAYINEAIYLKYICEFSDDAGLYIIEFTPAGEHEKYTLKNLRQSESIVNGRRVNTYEFIAYPKIAGEILFDFEVVMKKTTKESIENSIIGRDNVKREDFVKKYLKQEILSVHVKETKSDLVGSFTVVSKKNEPKVKAYEPYHMEIKIQGNGNFLAFKPIAFEIDGVKVFAGEVKQNTKLDKNGQSGEWSQKFAFVSEKDFQIPQVKIEYFNLNKQKLDALVIDGVGINVEKGLSKDELLDKVEEKSFKFDATYIYYMLVFAAGFLAGKIKIKKRAITLSKDDEFKQKVRNAKSLDELMVILALSESKKYEEIIINIERKKITSLGSAKKLIVN